VPPTIPHTPTFEQFQALASVPPTTPGTGWAIPVYRTLLSDHLTPVTAYERLARKSHHAFLLESVVGGERIARYSFLAVNPRTLIKAYAHRVTIEQREGTEVTNSRTFESPDPLKELENLLKPIQGVRLPTTGPGTSLPSFVGGAVGYAAYDTVRYLEPEKLTNTPKDDRGLPDMLFGIYDEVVIFDNVQKTVLVVANAHVAPNDRRTYKEIYAAALARIDNIIKTLLEPIAFELASIDLAC